MINIPINKTILATLAFIFSNWKRLLEASIFPFFMALPVIIILPKLIGAINDLPQPGSLSPDNLNFPIIYLLMFIYATMALLINIYRLVVLGNNSITKLGIVIPNLKFGRFLLLSVLLAVGQGVAIFLPFMFPFIYLLLIPISLNLVSIANDVSYKKIEVSFRARLNIFLINFIVPFTIITLVGLIGNSYLDVLLTFLSIYWTSISLALCYSVIFANSSRQSL